MDQQLSEMTPNLPPEGRSLEQALAGLWERVKRAGETIQHLREERQALISQVAQLREEVRQLQEGVLERDQRLQQLTAEHQGHTGRNAVLFGNGEKEELAARVKELLAKIDAYL